MLRDYIRLNQSMLIAIAVALPVAAAAAHMLSDVESHLNTTYVTIIDYVAYLGTFGLLFYLTNRHRYKMPTGGGLPQSSLRADLKKIIASLGIGEVVYGVVRWLLQYYLIELWGYEPYLSSVIAQSVAIVVYLAVMNLSVRATRMYEGGSSRNNDYNNNNGGNKNNKTEQE